MSLRVSSDFKRRLVDEAKKDKRSVANYIEATLTRLWQEKDFDATRRSKKSTWVQRRPWVLWDPLATRKKTFGKTNSS